MRQVEAVRPMATTKPSAADLVLIELIAALQASGQIDHADSAAIFLRAEVRAELMDVSDPDAEQLLADQVRTVTEEASRRLAISPELHVMRLDRSAWLQQPEGPDPIAQVRRRSPARRRRRTPDAT